eukprot:COSAG01_NODE_14124_length_1493_cov_55.829986_1_plen_334_part_00
MAVVVTAPKGVVLRSGVEKASAKVGVAKLGEALELKRVVRTGSGTLRVETAAGTWATARTSTGKELISGIGGVAGAVGDADARTCRAGAQMRKVGASAASQKHAARRHVHTRRLTQHLRTGGRSVAAETGTVSLLASTPLPHGARLCVSAGSVLDFGGETNWPREKTAVVNAANVGGLGGGGVDGAFVQRGGKNLRNDRKALPKIAGGGRIRVGGAVVTGPNEYGSLFANTVIHAVGPAYFELNSLAEGDALLHDAYASSMACAKEVGMEYVGFSLLSAGIFRGKRSLEDVLRVAVEAVRGASYEGLKEVHLVAFLPEEQRTLVECLQTLEKK